MQLRAARAEDRDRLYAIWHSAVLATHDFLAEEDRLFFARIVRDQYLPNAAFWVAVDGDDRPLGFLGMTEAHVDALFVAPEAHGRGIGKAMMAHARRLHPRLTVDVNEQNARALAFYRRLGFEVTGRSETDSSGKPYPLIHLRLDG